MHKDYRKVAKELVAQGFEVTATRKCHYQVRLNGRRVATLVSTPGDQRAIKNVISECRKAGFVWNGH